MILVVAFCSKDADLQRRNLEWALELDAGCGREGVLSYDTLTSKEDVAAIDALAQRYFTKVHHCCYSEPPVKGWPAACNWAWQSTARWMYESPLKQPWLWLEADAMPLKSGWLLTLEEAFLKGGKNFAGHVVKDMHHMNGVGIYPWDVMGRNDMAMMARAAAWDVVLKTTTMNDCTPLNHLIQHAWNVHPQDRTMIWNGAGTPLTFRSKADVALYLDFNAVLLHRIKDGSLIELLRGKQIEDKKFETTAYNVPQHTAGGVVEVATEPVVGNTEILIVTYGLPTLRPPHYKKLVSDFDWLQWCLRSIRRYCTGFSGVTLAIPDRDAALLQPISNEHAKAKSGIPLRVKLFSEPHGKGFLMHEVMMARADELVPKSTDFVLHVDPDVIFKEPVTPAEYVQNGKPVYVWRTYESLCEMREGQKVVSDCLQWKNPTEAQLGFEVFGYFMTRHPSGFPVEFYKSYREHIECVQKMPFQNYMLAGRNDFPANRMDFTAMGAYAFQFMHDKFHWIDISDGNHLAPRDKQQCYWSHHGVTPELQKQIEGLLA